MVVCCVLGIEVVHVRRHTFTAHEGMLVVFQQLSVIVLHHIDTSIQLTSWMGPLWSLICMLSSSIERKLLSRITASCPQGTYWNTIVSLSRCHTIHTALPFYMAHEAEAKISFLMCSDSKRAQTC